MTNHINKDQSRFSGLIVLNMHAIAMFADKKSLLKAKFTFLTKTMKEHTAFKFDTNIKI